MMRRGGGAVFTALQNTAVSLNINMRAEERRHYNFAVFWHDKAEAVWRMLTNERDATTLGE